MCTIAHIIIWAHRNVKEKRVEFDFVCATKKGMIFHSRGDIRYTLNVYMKWTVVKEEQHTQYIEWKQAA